jgi:4a-hydroxytetrahydrobiopterin dehydratase
MEMSLTQKNCVPCEGGIPKLSLDEAKQLLAQIPSWELGEKIIRKNFKFKNFREAMVFINHMAEIAEAEGHHPDFTVHYNRVEVEIWTHAIGGLSENDFILAAKLDQIGLTP